MVYLAVASEYLGEARSDRADAFFLKGFWDLALGESSWRVPGGWHRVAVFGVSEGLRRGKLQQSRIVGRDNLP